jgi:RNA polymerase sigma factor (sigma-70 family)
VVTSLSDIELLAAARAGDPGAFGSFYTRHREVLLRFLARRVTEPEFAADLLAEAFASALLVVRNDARALPETPLAWLFTIARNLLIDSLRRGQVEMEARRRLGLERLALDDQDIQRITEAAGSDDVIAELSAAIPASEWEAFHAHVIADESYAQLAERLRCSEAVTRKRVSRARAQLRTILGGTDV